MTHNLHFFIGGRWVEPTSPDPRDVIDPATEKAAAQISFGSAADVDRAVTAAREAFQAYSATTREERTALIERIGEVYKQRAGDLAAAITLEVGAPRWFAERAQVGAGLAHLKEILKVLRDYRFEERRGGTLIEREPIGVCGLITPWNWPLNQIMCKVMPALAAGCTMVLKPSEVAPLNAIVLAEIFEEAGVPAGVFNLVNGDGPGVGEAMSRHPGIDMMSFTGSTRAGIQVAKSAADTVKRVQQELGGKSASIVLPGADTAKAVASTLQGCFFNSGQSCNAPTRLFVEAAREAEAIEAAKAGAATMTVGDPNDKASKLGPVISAIQFDKVQGFIRSGLAEGATLVAGGPGRPDGLARGYYVKPTVFAGVRPDMTISREEIFGPVLSIIPYGTVEEAIRMANDTPYGLAGYVWGPTVEEASIIARQLRAGSIHLNGAGPDFGAPFGGYKQSGNGREWGRHGLDEMTEVKATLGIAA